MKKSKSGQWTMTAEEAIPVFRRVLRLANAYIRRQKQDLLITDGRGLMTWGEVRSHIQACLGVKIKRGGR